MSGITTRGILQAFLAILGLSLLLGAIFVGGDRTAVWAVGGAVAPVAAWGINQRPSDE